MDKGAFAARYLTDTLHKQVVTSYEPLTIVESKPLYSQPVDSLLKIMMHRSDNFFAEQTLLMVSNQVLGVMNDRRITDSLLNSDLKELPQKPKWVDGSGLSRYNLFSPQDFVWLLNKMEREFGIERMKEILPTGGQGTLSSLYKEHAGRIYAKTGTLSNHVALSGYLFTKKNKMLIFSVLANNQLASSTNIRKSIEKFVTSLIEKY
jgi:D-alanyl-D-alanine carboxypeptidase/D-alanyl-D-alanine-endopeptidase (penicillin-binding protein 4)